jgi:hypothetical protein
MQAVPYGFFYYGVIGNGNVPYMIILTSGSHGKDGREKIFGSHPLDVEGDSFSLTKA